MPEIRLYNNQGSSLQGTGDIRLYEDSPTSRQPIQTTPYKPSLLESTFSQSVKNAQDLGIDPLSLKANPKKAIGDAWNVLKDSVVNEWKNIKDVSTAEGDIFNPDFSASKIVGGYAKTVAGAGGIVFSPLTALFEGAKSIPVLGTVSKLLSVPFSVVGEGVPHITDKIIDELPISEEAKKNLKPGIGEISALAGQLALGKITEIGTDKISELTKKYGAKDASTIIQKAQEIARTNPVEPATGGGIRLYPEKASQTLKTVPGEAMVGKTGKVAPELESLAQEARKYKSAEEFVKAQTDTPVGFNLKTETDVRKYLYKDQTPKKVKLEDLEWDNPELLRQATEDVGEGVKRKIDTPIIVETRDGRIYVKDGNHRVAQAAENGDSTILVFEEIPKSKVKSQLTDLWNKVNEANKEIPATGEVKPRGLSVGIEQKAIENKLTKGFGDLPEYQTVNMSEQARLAKELIEKDYETAKRVAMGQEASPQGIIPEMLLKVVEDKAIKVGDVTTIRELGTQSGLLSEATTMGQRIRALAERDSESPVSAIIEVKKARMERVKESAKATQKTKAEIREEIRKTKPTKETWDKFVDSLIC